MAHGIVAARLQALLIELCLAMREGKSGNELFLLLGLASLQATFPLPAQSAEAEMVASRIEQRATLEERKVWYAQIRFWDPSSMASERGLHSTQRTTMKGVICRKCCLPEIVKGMECQ